MGGRRDEEFHERITFLEKIVIEQDVETSTSTAPQTQKNHVCPELSNPQDDILIVAQTMVITDGLVRPTDATPNAIVLVATVACPVTSCDGAVTVPLVLNGVPFGPTEIGGSTYEDESAKNALCSKCSAILKVTSTLQTTVEVVADSSGASVSRIPFPTPSACY